MNELIEGELTRLSPEECLAIHGGGGPLAYVVYFTSCFAAGFDFGYNKLGPALFG
jgi:hypothetical protein